jgi:hypothetical protein
MLYGGLAVFAVVGLGASFVYEARVAAWREQLYAPEPIAPEPEFWEMYMTTRDNFSEETRYFADRWIRSVWRACNTGELSADPAWIPPPATEHGDMFMAGCFALAGRINESRRIVDGLDEGERPAATGILIDVVMPAARQGRFEVASPALELGLQYWPQFQSARFHAGLGRLAVGDLEGARAFLVRVVQDETPGTFADQMRAKARELVAFNDSVLAARAAARP